MRWTPWQNRDFQSSHQVHPTVHWTRLPHTLPRRTTCTKIGKDVNWQDASNDRHRASATGMAFTNRVCPKDRQFSPIMCRLSNFNRPFHHRCISNPSDRRMHRLNWPSLNILDNPCQFRLLANWNWRVQPRQIHVYLSHGLYGHILVSLYLKKCFFFGDKSRLSRAPHEPIKFVILKTATNANWGLKSLQSWRNWSLFSYFVSYSICSQNPPESPLRS